MHVLVSTSALPGQLRAQASFLYGRNPFGLLHTSLLRGLDEFVHGKLRHGRRDLSLHVAAAVNALTDATSAYAVGADEVHERLAALVPLATYIHDLQPLTHFILRGMASRLTRGRRFVGESYHVCVYVCGWLWVLVCGCGCLRVGRFSVERRSIDG